MRVNINFEVEMELDPFLLSRIQFAANITFHIMFPSITIALGWFLLFFKLRYNKTGDESWMDTYFFFTKVFALSFAIGVVSGVTMSFQFGTNWPGFMEKVGNVAGPLLAYEVLTAFFLEATFLGIMLFGFRRVPGWLHTTATVLVAVGTTLSAFWILVLNSWMHTPAGFEMINGQAFVTSWWEVVFNPSMPYRLTHMLLASGLTASFLIAGLSAYRYLKGDRAGAVTKGLKTGIIAAACLIPLQIYAGHEHGLNTKEYQPAKLAAMEGAWETMDGAPFVVFGWPNEADRRNDYSFEIPNLASLIITNSLTGTVQGLNDFEVHPPVAPVFWGFRIMVGIGMLMLLSAWIGSYYIVRRKPLPRFMLYTFTGMTLAGCIATIAGWYVTEIGRQPWLVEGVMTTEEALGPVSGGMVLSTLLVYLAIYVFLSIAYITTLFYLAGRAGDGGRRDPQNEKVVGGERHTIMAAAE
jgi:cytochrome d ubiquinol oxidase subunit I